MKNSELFAVACKNAFLVLCFNVFETWAFVSFYHAGMKAIADDGRVKCYFTV